jgi:hypothetical protein
MQNTKNAPKYFIRTIISLMLLVILWLVVYLFPGLGPSRPFDVTTLIQTDSFGPWVLIFIGLLAAGPGTLLNGIMLSISKGAIIYKFFGVAAIVIGAIATINLPSIFSFDKIISSGFLSVL